MNVGAFMKSLALCGYPQRFRSPLVLAQSGVPASVTGTTTETTLATIAIPAGALGPNGKLRITALYSSTLNATNNDVFRVRLAGNSLFSSGNVTNVASYQAMAIISNASGQAAQRGSTINGGGGSGSAVLTSAVDMTQAQSLTITGQIGLTTDTIQLLNYTVEILNP